MISKNSKWGTLLNHHVYYSCVVDARFFLWVTGSSCFLKYCSMMYQSKKYAPSIHGSFRSENAPFLFASDLFKQIRYDIFCFVQNKNRSKWTLAIRFKFTILCNRFYFQNSKSVDQNSKILEWILYKTKIFTGREHLLRKSMCICKKRWK